MGMFSEAHEDQTWYLESQVKALNDRNQYLETTLAAAYKHIHVLEQELEAAYDYSRQQADRQYAEEEFQRNIHGYEGQP